MDVELIVCGSSGSHTGPGRACSGYLLRADDCQIMLDCGNGSTANLQQHTEFHELDAVIVSHRHVDHCVDLVGMYYQLKFLGEGPSHVDLYYAPQVLDLLTGILSEDSAMEFRDTFHSREIDAGQTLEIGPFRVDLHRNIHPVPTLAMRIEVDGHVIVYSSDTGGADELVEVARGADLLLCEATWQGDMDEWPSDMHLTAREAGKVASRADVGRLILTHIQGGSDLDRALEEARETFSGHTALAHDNHTWNLT